MKHKLTHVYKVQIPLKILSYNFLFFHYKAEVGTWFYILKTAIHTEICVECLKCGAFCSRHRRIRTLHVYNEINQNTNLPVQQLAYHLMIPL